MTSTQTQPHYDYTRPSTAATRALVSSDSSATGQAKPSDQSSPHGTLHRRKTNNYETALADQVNTTVEQTANMSLENPSSSAQSARPGVGGALGRQQSWKRDDLKRVNMERMLSSDAGKGGYTTAV